MSRMFRGCLLVFALALSALLPARLVRAAELLPSGAAVDEADRKKIETYRALSARALKDVLTPLVEKAAYGTEFPGPRWERQCADVLTALGALKKQDVIPESLDKWFAEEWAAWTNIRTIGMEMLDTHFRMAWTLELIEQDTKDSIEFARYLKDKLSRANDKAGIVEDRLDDLSSVADDFSGITDIAGDIATGLDVLKDNAEFISKVLSTFRNRCFTFIKEKDLSGKYRDDLAKLKSRKLDPNETGVFATFEKDWEEEMYKTYQRYLKAVEEWNRANRWLTKDELKKFVKTNLPKAVEIGADKILGLPVSPLDLADPEKLGEWCGKVKVVLRKAMEIAKQDEWARIEEELEDWEERRQNANMAHDETVREAEAESERLARAEIEKRIDVLDASAAKIEKLEEELDFAEADLTDEATRAAAVEKIRRLNAQIETEERARDKQVRHHDEQIRFFRNAWLRKQEDEAYRKLRTALDEIEKEERKLRDERPR